MIAKQNSGIVLALALHAIQLWSHERNERIVAAIDQGIVALLTRALSCSLADCHGPDMINSYVSSVAIILLRSFLRSDNALALQAIEDSDCLTVLFQIVKHSDTDRSLCLSLYMLNDLSRRSAHTMSVIAGTSDYLSSVARVFDRPLSEMTKFAVLLVNRWAVDSRLAPLLKQCGILEKLLSVLHCCAKDTKPHATSTAAYALSALSILAQQNIEGIREMILDDASAHLWALTSAMEKYCECFEHSVGHPHVFFSGLLDGEQGAKVADALVENTLCHHWLPMRFVGGRLLTRAMQNDMLSKFSCLSSSIERRAKTVLALSHLLEKSSLFLKELDNLDHLTAAAQFCMKEGILVAPEDAEKLGRSPYTSALSRVMSWLDVNSEQVVVIQKSDDRKKNKRIKRLEFRREDVNVQRFDTMTIRIGNRPFYAVSFVLEAWSPMLRQLMRSTETTLSQPLLIPPIANFSDAELYKFFTYAVEHCYTGRVNELKPEEALKLWIVADYFQADSLQDYCEAVLERSFAVSEAILRQSYEVGLRFGSGKGLRIKAAIMILRTLIAGERVLISPSVRALVTENQDALAKDMAQGLVDMIKTVSEQYMLFSP